ncbi:MAG: L,D-transpeptidase family protein [Flavobacteriales bacterium]
MRIYKFILSAGLLFVLLFPSCGGEKEFLAEKDLSIEEKLEKVSAHFREWIDDEYRDSAVVQGYYLASYKALFRIYDSVSFQPVWSKNLELETRTKAFMGLLSKSAWYGLDSGLYYAHDIRVLLDSAGRDKNFVTKARNVALCDVLLCNAYLLLNVHLEKGYLDSASGKQVWKIDSLHRDVVKELFEYNDESQLKTMLNRQPQNIEYRYLMAALKTFLDSTVVDTRTFTLPDLKTDSLACRDSIKTALIHWGFLDTAYAASDSAQLASFKKFQLLHGMDDDGVPGKNSVACMRISHYDRFMQACLAVEKWKWKKPRQPSIMLRVNIPSYTLHVIRNDSIIRKHRVVTGLPDKQTPQFRARLRWITLFPYWNVPHSISTEEIVPHLRRSDTAYLRKHEYEMFALDKNLADLTAVPWKKLSKDYFPYRLRQKGGPLNALGLIQFHFPNKHDVYLHDTPAKYFFRKNTRCFSHGCIRLQNPFDFGVFILKQDLKIRKDTFNVDTLRAWVNKKIEQRIILKRSIPIELDYITVTGDSLGNITFHYDIYSKDVKYMKYMYPTPSPLAKAIAKEKATAPKKKKKKEKLAYRKQPFRKFAQKMVFLFPGAATPGES